MALTSPNNETPEPAGNETPQRLAEIHRLPGVDTDDAAAAPGQASEADAPTASTELTPAGGGRPAPRVLARVPAGVARWGRGVKTTGVDVARGSVYTHRAASIRDQHTLIGRDEWFPTVPALRRTHQALLWAGLVWYATWHLVGEAGRTPSRQAGVVLTALAVLIAWLTIG